MQSPFDSPLSGIRSPFGGRRLGFSIAALFANGEQGVAFEPDPNTCFTDTEATTTAGAGDSTAFMLDGSQGAGYKDGEFTGLGPELAPNDGVFLASDWDEGTGWSVSNGEAVWSGGTDAFLQAPDVYVLGKYHVISFEVFDLINGQCALRLPGNANGNLLQVSTNGVFTVVGLHSGTDLRVFFRSISSDGFKIRNLSVRELPGNHATQPDAAARPILARVPDGGRRNLLTRTEEFDDASWTKTSQGTGSVPIVTPDFVSGPFAGTFADRVQFNLNGGISGGDVSQITQSIVFSEQNHVGAIWIRSNTGSNETIYLLIENAQRATFTVTPEWQRLEGVHNDIIGLGSNFGLRARGGTSDAADLLIFGAQLEPGSTATPYQRVGSEFDVTEAGKADKWHLVFDGVDDDLLSGPFTMPNIHTVWVGVSFDEAIGQNGNNNIFELAENSDMTGVVAALDLSRGSGPHVLRTFYPGVDTVYNALAIDSFEPGKPFVFSVERESTSLIRQRDELSGNSLEITDLTTNYTQPVYFRLGDHRNSGQRLNGKLFSFILRGSASAGATVQKAADHIINKRLP